MNAAARTVRGSLPIGGEPGNDCWETPAKLFAELNAEFHFTLDPCSNGANAKCEKFYTPAEDGLAQGWTGERVFMNPPYSDCYSWMKKAYESKETVVCLIPARTDTKWWHEFALKGEIRFVRGRLRFVGAPYNAPFPSAIVIFRKRDDA